jgi:hypothetical protein
MDIIANSGTYLYRHLHVLYLYHSHLGGRYARESFDQWPSGEGDNSFQCLPSLSSHDHNLTILACTNETWRFLLVYERFIYRMLRAPAAGITDRGGEGSMSSAPRSALIY